MYIRKDHAEGSLKALRKLIRENPLGVFTTAIDSPTNSYPFLQSSHIPFILDVSDEDSESELGVIRGHMARANPQSKAIIEEATTSGKNVLERDVLILFTSRAQHYVTPKFYTETKPTTGKVVPTWNYAAVQVYGKARVYVDTKDEATGSFLGQQVHDLTEFNEQDTMGFTGKGDAPGPWKVTDAPENYVNLLKKAIIGVEVTVEKMEGKWKMSQEMSDGDIEGVEAGFGKLGSEVGTEVAELVKKGKEAKDAKKT